MTCSARRFRVTCLATALWCATASITLFAAEAAAPTASVEATVSTVLELTNAERVKAGLAPLRENSRLQLAAQLQSEQMGSVSRMDHVLREARYPNPTDRLAAAKYVWEAYAENVAMGQRSAAEVVSAWMHSPGHRANILNPNYTELGIGYALDAAGHPYYAQVFGRPGSQRVALSIR